MDRNGNGFSLVELLVVVTIIVVLIALISPALDGAIYQAELAVCAAKLKTVGSGMGLYALEHRRSFPQRSYQSVNLRPDYLYLDAVTNDGDVFFDDRTPLKGYVQVNASLNCPLSPEVDLELEDQNHQTIIYSNYARWYGFKFVVKNQQESAMQRLGDRFTWTDGVTDPGSPVQYRFDVLADDSDSIDSTKWVGTPHPDKDGKMAPEVWHDRLNTTLYTTFSFWTERDLAVRGPVDRNFVHTDGSTRRINDLAIDDDRLVPVPDRSSTTGWGNPGRRRWLPRGE